MGSNVRRWGGLVMAAALGIAVAAPGCTYTSNTTAIQCTSEAECLNLGPEFAGTTCDKVTRSCIKVPTDQDLCKTNKECIDKAGGVPAICRKSDRKCAQLTSPECPRVWGNTDQLLNDKAVVIGALTPFSHSALADFTEAALRLGQADITKVVRGLPSVDGSSDIRPLVIASCDEFFHNGFDGLVVAANHLAKDLEVPVNIGPIAQENVLLATEQVFRPNKVLTIVPLSVSSGLIKPEPTPMAWGLAVNDKKMTQASQLLIQKVLEPRLRDEGVTSPIKVAIVYEDNVLGLNARQLMESKLSYNGKSASQNAIDKNYLAVSIGNVIDHVGNPAPELKVAQAVRAVLDFKPNIILHAVAPGSIPLETFPLLTQWPRGTRLPYHLDLVAVFGTFAPLFDLLTAIVPMRSRFFSITNHLAPEVRPRIDDWVTHFTTEFPQLAQSSSPSATLVHQWYDAVFLAAYAIVANGNKPLTGENLAATLSQFNPPGSTVRSGTADITRAFGLLNSGQGIDLDGLSGNLNFDLATGFVDYEAEISCPEIDTKTGRVVNFKATGYYTEGDQVRGTFTCNQ
ncbi:hypothetical protein LVJ94_30315 [Pendulispora rubella]|uniref:ABC transporter substrate-binding protein n=1 Tax=Pendulispora rubella TaxID=2741070 RepID=A0ABZ2KRP3_9BACT